MLSVCLLAYSLSATDELGPFTCHSCKQKCPQIWSLLEHVFTAHGFRISDEDLPNFAYPIAGANKKVPRLVEAATICDRQRPQKLVADRQEDLLKQPSADGSAASLLTRSGFSSTPEVLPLFIFCLSRNGPSPRSNQVGLLAKRFLLGTAAGNGREGKPIPWNLNLNIRSQPLADQLNRIFCSVLRKPVSRAGHRLAKGKDGQEGGGAAASERGLAARRRRLRVARGHADSGPDAGPGPRPKPAAGKCPGLGQTGHLLDSLPL
jgi:hypothetical protein